MHMCLLTTMTFELLLCAIIEFLQVISAYALVKLHASGSDRMTLRKNDEFCAHDNLNLNTRQIKFILPLP